MEDLPSGEDNFNLAPIGWEIAVPGVDSDNAVEALGKTRQDRLDDIEHARQFRLTLIHDTVAQLIKMEEQESQEIQAEWDEIDEILRNDAWNQKREELLKFERRRQGYVMRYEGIDQALIEELLTTLDPDNPEGQSVLSDKLRQVYADLKTRLVIVEMETRRLMYKTYARETGISETKEERLMRVIYGGQQEIDIAGLLLIEIDALRDKSLGDKSIYRQLMREYHPDVSDHEKAKEITQHLSAIYNDDDERFLV